jgi:hypothetical protein
MRRNDEMNPLLTLHREMNRVFEEVFRGAYYDPAIAPSDRHGIDQGNGWQGSGGQGSGWPHIEVAKTGKEVKVIVLLIQTGQFGRSLNHRFCSSISLFFSPSIVSTWFDSWTLTPSRLRLGLWSTMPPPDASATSMWHKAGVILLLPSRRGTYGPRWLSRGPRVRL